MARKLSAEGLATGDVPPPRYGLAEKPTEGWQITLVEAPWFTKNKKDKKLVQNDVLYVNAWCHSAFVGNGNRADDTLDGAYGCLADFASAAWPMSNPWIRARSLLEPKALCEKERTVARADRSVVKYVPEIKK